MRSKTLATAIAAVLLLLAACTGKDAVDTGPAGDFRYVTGTKKGTTIAPADRKAAGDVTGEYLDGSEWRLSSSAGKVAFVNFWGSWCAPCRAEMPAFETVYQQMRPKGVDFVGIAIKDVKSKTEAFVDALDITYPIVFDEAARTALRFGRLPVDGPGSGLPLSIVIDKQQRVAAVYIGIVSAGDLLPVLAALSAEK